ncbi:NAD(P)/FAD-dependent oxidoreductase [Thauera sinica]|uniref:NAD(P)/FAD-dependent oxidoreductase n=1 Tax=Thauera sinica TaxID=2665146 RepID=A0ABW1AXU9_9RHOO|nr:FAD-dependent oxidoreductase [Thauera sp. K11]ATE61227.1 FAD-dependent oxidoreductase [Thauera sp. K11]
MHFDIVIVGGGAGGLELAARLGRKLGPRQGRERVLLVDRAVFHIWKPTLHEVAAGTLDAHQEGLSYPVLARRNHFSFALGELAGLDGERRLLTLGETRDEHGGVLVPTRTISFGRLVLAMGSGSNSFGTPGAEHAHVLEHASDAQRFHAKLLAAFARASFSAEKTLSIAIVGGGATGVELSAELIEAHNELLESLGSEQRFRLDIALVEAADRILAGLPEQISAQARLALERKNVRVLTATRVTEVRRDRLLTTAGEIPADIIVWAAGIKAADANREFGLETNRINQFVVNDRLETSVPNVYALGDCAACRWQGDKLVPARAQAAHQQAGYLAGVLLAALQERRIDAPFVYRDFGSLVSLGENKGIGNLMGGLSGRNFFVEGLIAKWMYMSLHLNHHRAILGTGKTAVLALARLLQQRVSGRLKLH